MSWRKNRKTKRPFIVTVVNRKLDQGGRKGYGKTLAESRYDPVTGKMELFKGASPVGMEHELGHLKLRRFGESISRGERNRINQELTKEHDSEYLAYTNSYYADNLEEAVAETFAAKKYGWKNTDLGFNPEKVTPKIWAFVKRVDKEYG